MRPTNYPPTNTTSDYQGSLPTTSTAAPAPRGIVGLG